MTSSLLRCSCRANGIKSDSTQPICHVAASDVDGGDAVGLRSGILQSGAIDDAAQVPRVHRASIQMAAMGLWRPPISMGGPGLDNVHHDEYCPGCTDCLQRLSG